MDDVPVELFLDAFPPPIRAIALELRTLVREADAALVERVRGGWALIGYDVALGRRKRYVAFVAPEAKHIHLGFEVGILSAPAPGTPRCTLGLKKVRYLTYRPGDLVDRSLVVDLVREAVSIGRMSSGERAALAAHRAVERSGA
jgi:hypothetical protein